MLRSMDFVLKFKGAFSEFCQYCLQNGFWSNERHMGDRDISDESPSYLILNYKTAIDHLCIIIEYIIYWILSYQGTLHYDVSVCHILSYNSIYAIYSIYFYIYFTYNMDYIHSICYTINCFYSIFNINSNYKALYILTVCYEI